MREFVVSFEDFNIAESLDSSVRKSMATTINKTAKWAKDEISDVIYNTINFPNGYLEESNRLTNTETTEFLLRAQVKGRDKPTSLARFATGPNKDLTVHVLKANAPVRNFNGWRATMKNGNAGLMTAVEKGMIPKGAPGARLMKSISAKNKKYDIFLLYSYSVDQAMNRVLNDKSLNLVDKVSNKMADFYKNIFEVNFK